MSTSPALVRAAASAFVAAIERHLIAVEHRTGEADPDVQSAFSDLTEAFVVYEDALYDAYDEVTPFDVADDEDDDFDDEEDDEDDEEDDDEDDLDEQVDVEAAIAATERP